MNAAEHAEDWAAEFTESTAFRLLPAGVKEHTAGIVVRFLEASKDLTEESTRRVLLEEMPLLDLPAPARGAIPDILRAFLEWLQDSGRTGEGYPLGRFIGALAGAYHRRCDPKGGIRAEPVVHRTAPIGRNDPCPCGSGKKYKKCCANG
jgi:hypothetical protein